MNGILFQTGAVMSLQKDPLLDLPYFIPWGGTAAIALTRQGIEEHLSRDLTGKQLLEIGAAGGRMSSLFGLLGAKVTGVDIDPDFPKEALAEAKKWKVLDRVDFQKGSGTLEMLPNGSFDIVFTKSMLLYIENLKPFLEELSTKLKPGGQICFIENVARNSFDRQMRDFYHLLRGRRNYHYMTDERIELIGEIFELEVVRFISNSSIRVLTTPGWYLIYGHRR